MSAFSLNLFVRAARREKLPLAVYAQLVDALYGTYASFVAGMVCGSAVGLVSWLRSGDPIFLWATAAIFGTCAFRTVTLFWYRSQPRGDDMRLREIAAWELRYAAGAWAFMLALGVTSALGVYEGNDLITLLYGSVVAVGCAGAIAGRNSARPLIVSGQVLLCCGPLAISLLSSGEPYLLGVSGMILLFFAAVSSTTKTLYAGLRKALVQTQAVQKLAALHKREKTRFDDALNTMKGGLCMFDVSGRVVVINAGLRSYFPTMSLTSGATVVGFVEAIGEATQAHAEDLRRFGLELRDRLEGGRQTPVELLTADGSIFEFRVSLRAEGGAVVVVDDISERRAAEREIKHLAHYCSLTGLPNRFRFRDEIQRVLSNASKGLGGDISVLYVDLDGFKEINDSLGHPMGDKLLIEVAKRLHEAAHGDMVARLGGDEFVVLKTKSGSSPEQLAKRLIDAISESYAIDGHHLVVGASIGIASWPGDGETADDLIRSADMALYHAKNAGRGQYARFEPQMDADAQRRREIEMDLRVAVASGAFELHYQPLVDASSGRILACEALLRWRHPEKGLVSPAQFIPIAEDTGLIVAIGEWVLAKACKDAMNWPQGTRVAVNLSPIQFKRGDVVGAVLSALRTSGLPPERLECEITESLMMSDTPATREAISSLCAMGVRLALDDFGTGHSSLSRLHGIPFHKLKIDKSFVDKLGQTPESMAIVKAIVSLARELGKTVVAEGVETRVQMDILQKLHVTELQGYFFSKPVPIAELQAKLAEPRVIKFGQAA